LLNFSVDSLITESATKARGVTPWETMLQVVVDLCHFIMHQVIHPRGIFFQQDYELAMDPKCIDLRERENQQHYASSSSVGK
jgi:hypothetical protein